MREDVYTKINLDLLFYFQEELNTVVIAVLINTPPQLPHVAPTIIGIGYLCICIPWSRMRRMENAPMPMIVPRTEY